MPSTLIAVQVYVQRRQMPGWFVALFVVVAAAIAIALYLVVRNRPVRTIDTVAVQGTISQEWQAMQNSTPPYIVCPVGQPLRAGFIFDCTADVVPTPIIVRVTEDDARGHFHWAPTLQAAGFPPGGSG